MIIIRIHIHITGLTIHTGADTLTTTVTTDTTTHPGIQVTVILHTTTTTLNTLQIPAAGEATAQCQEARTQPRIQGASQAMHPEVT